MRAMTYTNPLALHRPAHKPSHSSPCRHVAADHLSQHPVLLLNTRRPAHDPGHSLRPTTRLKPAATVRPHLRRLAAFPHVTHLPPARTASTPKASQPSPYLPTPALGSGHSPRIQPTLAHLPHRSTSKPRAVPLPDRLIIPCPLITLRKPAAIVRPRVAHAHPSPCRSLQHWRCTALATISTTADHRRRPTHPRPTP
jgi:hypothetical protein